MKSVIFLLLGVLVLVGCAKPPEQVYHHPKTGQEYLVAHVGECGSIADRFGVINMSPVHQYPMLDMKDHFQREKVFEYCMRKKGYEQGDSVAIIIDENNTTINLSDTLLAVGETAQVTITFSSAVGGLENGDLTVEKGSLTEVSTADGGVTWTATFTPTPGIEDSNNVISLNNAGVIDAVSNFGSGITVSSSYAIDTLRPMVVIRIVESALGDGLGNYGGGSSDNSLVTFTFSETPHNFVKNDISVANGTLGKLVKDDSTHYHATFTAAKDFSGRGSVTVDATKFTDVASNFNPAATPAFVAIDTLSPTITASLDSADSHIR